MPRPICIPCGIEMHCHKNGVTVHIGGQRYCSGDAWRCPDCEHLIISGYGDNFFRDKPLPEDQVLVDLVQPGKQNE